MSRTKKLLTLGSFGLDQKGRKRRMRRAAAIVLAEWGAEAADNMGARSLSAYKASLAIVEVTDRTAIVALGASTARVSAKVARLALMVERGLGAGGIGTQGSFDLRSTILKGGTRRLRRGKRGFYVRVPFKLSGATIRALGGTALRRHVGSQAFKHSISGGKHKTLYGSKLHAGHSTKLKSHHTTDPLHGLYKFGSKYKSGKVRTSGFGTFRTISEGGKEWRHPGIKARRVADKVRRKLPKILGELL